MHSGRNSAFRSGLYAAIGGYNETSQLAEDLEMGWLIKEARGYGSDRIVYDNRASLISNPRRAVMKLVSGGRLIQQYGDFHVNEEVRTASLDDLLRNRKELRIEDLQKEVQSIYDHYARWKKSNGGWVEDSYIDRSFNRAMGFLGVSYRMSENSVVISSMDKMIDKLAKYQQAQV